MTPEELASKQQQLDKLKKLKQLRDLKAQKAQMQAAPEPEKERGLMDEAIGLSRSIASGAMLGFNDELASAVRAGVHKLQSGGDYGDLYDMYKADEKAEQKAYAEDRPVASFAGEMAGGVVNPLARWKKLQQLGQGAGALGRASGAAAQGGAEAAAYALGSQEDLGIDNLSENWKDIATDVAKNTALGAGSGAALSGILGTAGRIASNKRVDQDLVDAAGNFTPLHMAAPDSGIGRLYRDTVGAAYGSDALRDQEQAYLKRAMSADPNLAQFADRMGAQGSTARDVLDEARQGLAQGVSGAKRTAAEAAELAQTQADEQIAGLRKSLFREQATAALPSDAPKELRDLASKASTPDEMYDVARQASEWWDTKGFGKFQDMTFNVDRNLINGLEQVLEPEDFKFYSRVLEDAMESKQPISGKWLMELRNNPARASGRATGSNFGSLRGDVKKFDYQIERLLKKKNSKAAKEALDQFAEHRNLYGEKSDFMNAVRKADAKDMTAGFTERQLQASSPTRTRLGGGRGSYERARNVRKGVEAAEAGVQQVKDRGKAAIEAARQARAEGSGRIKEISRGMLAENPSTWSRVASTAVLGGPLSGSVVGAVPAGYAAAQMLSTKTGQKLAAGQTGLQRKLREAIQRGDMSEARRLMVRMGIQE